MHTFSTTFNLQYFPSLKAPKVFIYPMWSPEQLSNHDLSHWWLTLQFEWVTSYLMNVVSIPGFNLFYMHYFLVSQSQYIYTSLLAQHFVSLKLLETPFLGVFLTKCSVSYNDKPSNSNLIFSRRLALLMVLRLLMTNVVVTSKKDYRIYGEALAL